jgi:tetratricopeptide (TPR) repeat protein
MCIRPLRAVLTALLLGTLVSPAWAGDIVDFRDGKREPDSKDILTKWGEVPTMEDFAASKGSASLAYDEVTVGRRKVDAATVLKVYVEDAYKNADFQSGQLYGQRGYWAEAADSFQAAAEQLKGTAKEVALHSRVLALAASNDLEATFRAADDLLNEFPKTLYFGPVQEIRARILASQGKMNEAVDALKRVTAASGMNARDYYNAEYLRVWLTRFVAASTPQEFGAAEKEFRALIQDLDRNRGRQYAAEPRLKMQISLAVCLRNQGKGDEAKTQFNQVLAAADANTDKATLATLYNGLGDVAFEEAAALQSQKGDKTRIKELLEEAALHYLRVNLLYPGFAGQRELFGAAVGAARVFASLFQLTDDKDCDLARRSYEYYVRASQMQERGEAKRLLVNEGKALKKRLDVACGTPEEEAQPGSEDEGSK